MSISRQRRTIQFLAATDRRQERGDQRPSGFRSWTLGTTTSSIFCQNEVIRFGAFIEDIDLFDAEFFKMSPIQAQMLDPQQRLMLEMSWRDFEAAAIDPDGNFLRSIAVYDLTDNEWLVR